MLEKFVNKLVDNFRKLALGIAISGAALSAAQAQPQTTPAVGEFSVQAVTLPYSTLAPGAAGSGGTSTNLGLGWSTIASNVLISTTWNSSSNAFISTTNVTYQTNTSFADMLIPFQKDLFVMIGFNSTTAPTNRTLTFARLLDSGSVDNVNTTNVTILSNGNTNVNYGIEFPATWLGGAGGVRIVNDLWTGTNAALTMTNNYIKFGQKKFAF